MRLDTPLRGIEIGCGAGTLRQQLEWRGAWTVSGADISGIHLIFLGIIGEYIGAIFEEVNQEAGSDAPPAAIATGRGPARC